MLPRRTAIADEPPLPRRVETLGLYLRTIVRLRPSQIFWRLLFMARGRLGLEAGTAAVGVARRRRLDADAEFLLKDVAVSARSDTLSFDFLNVRHDFEGAVDWNPEGRSRLWKYNLHYFDWLSSRQPLDPATQAQVMADWVASNPAGAPDAWDPFPVSLRLVNWIKHFLRHEAGQTLLDSAYAQALWLERRLERHILANHLWKNAKALVFAGLFFAGRDADRWLRRGLRLVMRELAEQVLPDGAHYERSPMYHSMVFEDCLDLYNICARNPELCGREVIERLRTALPPMAAFLGALTHPDGQIALFNDAAMGIEALPADLLAYYERLTGLAAPAPTAASSFDHAGYHVLAPRPGAKLVVDCGDIGPDYQPGHSHCDTLSFELSVEGRRVVVDAGCCQYEDGELRRYLRGNAGHNTVTVDGRNQSEVWGSHRCARRARPISATLVRAPDDSLVFEGAHDGYRRLDGSPTHSRRISWRDKIIRVQDRVSGAGSHRLEFRLHINPELEVRLADGRALVLAQGRGLVGIAPLGAGSLRQEQGRYCPRFGVARPCVVLQVVLEQAKLPCDGGWLIEILGGEGE